MKLILVLLISVKLTQCYLFTNMLNSRADELILSLERQLALNYIYSNNSSQSLQEKIEKFENIRVDMQGVAKKYRFRPCFNYAISHLYALKAKQVNVSPISNCEAHLDSLAKGLNMLMNRNMHSNFHYDQAVDETVLLKTMTQLMKDQLEAANNEVSNARYERPRKTMDTLGIMFALFAVINDVCANIFMGPCMILWMAGASVVVLFMASVFNAALTI